MSTVLLTGASGFIAVHILKELLATGYYVRATVRSESKSTYLREKFATDKLTFAIVPDIAVPGAFDDAVRDIDYIIHTASPSRSFVENNFKDLLSPAINGTQGILQSAKRYGPTIRQVIITSSFAAVIDPPLNLNGRPRFTEADWNSITMEQAISADTETAYCASKKLAEKAAWDFIENERPWFTITVFNPLYVWGPMEHDTRLSSLPASNALLYNSIKYKINSEPSLVYGFVDVRDLAAAHVSALGNPRAHNQRFLICGGLYTFDAITSIIQRYLIEGESYAQGPDDSADVSATATANAGGVDTTKIVASLGIKFRSLKTCIIDLMRQLIEIDNSALTHLASENSLDYMSSTVL